MTTTERKQELRKRGEQLLKQREERQKALRVARGLPATSYALATIERETRSMGIDRSNYGGSEVRSSNGGMKTLSGTAVVYGSRSLDLGGFREIVKPGAFTRSLASKADVQCLRDHDPSQLLGRTNSGTLTLTDSSSGLGFSCTLPDTSAGRDVQALCERRDLSQCSFGFTCDDDDWSEDSNGYPLRTIRAAGLFDVSAVSSPAYEATSCSVRSVDEMDEMRLRQLVIACHRARKPIPQHVTTRLAEIADRS
jgi:HK97 family phage prohead protease